MIDRMIRASQASVPLYEEVERDRDLTSQAATVVVVVAIASGIGQLRDGGIVGLVGGIVFALIGWVLWSLITYWVGKTFFATRETDVTVGQMLRTLGFAESPGVLNVLGLIPVLGAIVGLIVGIWTLVLGVIAIRQAMDFSTGRAIATAVVGFIPAIVLFAILAAIVS